MLQLYLIIYLIYSILKLIKKDYTMATARSIDNAFKTQKVKNDLDIEKYAYKNIKLINDKDVKEIHDNLMNVLEAESEDDTMYYDLFKFKELIQEQREKKRKNEEKAKQREAKKKKKEAEKKQADKQHQQFQQKQQQH